MRYVEPPPIAALATLRQIQDSLPRNLQAAIDTIRARVQRAYAQYDIAAPDALHLLHRAAISKAARDALHSIFKKRLGEFRNLLDDLTVHFEGTGNSTCPYCNFGEQWEHDHYLPKSIFPEYTLYPKNLVPICKVCNGKKQARYELNGSRLFLHLFSELDGAQSLLRVSVQYSPRIRVLYSINNPGLPTDQFAVLERHFQKLGLANRYARQASATISRLIKQFRTAESLSLGRRKLRLRLRRMAADSAVLCPANHWEVTLLEQLASSPDFTNYVFA